jgi:predicted nucleotidyltransferase
VAEFNILNEVMISPLKKAGAQVWIFGSRARGDHKKFSDVDILYEFPAKVRPPSGFVFSVKADLDESRFPFLVDLVAAQDLAESYKEQVLRDRKTL